MVGHQAALPMPVEISLGVFLPATEIGEVNRNCLLPRGTWPIAHPWISARGLRHQSPESNKS